MASRNTCPPAKRALCVNATDGCTWTSCKGFDYAADCCGTCMFYTENSVEPYPGWYETHHGVCDVSADADPCGGTFADFVPTMWTDGPCMFFERG